jgi:hypothetical protein
MELLDSFKSAIMLLFKEEMGPQQILGKIYAESARVKNKVVI